MRYTSIDEQSHDIALGVGRALEIKERDVQGANGEEIGAGDQEMMFGYATNEAHTSCNHYMYR